ncbi:MAG: GntR family transcriptional regulator [Massilibacillus sp.]|nr:GntR family transcriptional regulator [Massilibacillus sp.]
MFILDSKNKTPLYRQLYQQLRVKILNGEIPPQARLASSRKLSADLKVSRNTVDTAYQQLLAEGYIVGKSRSGYYVETINNVNVSFVPEIAEVETLPEPSDEKIKYDFTYGNLPPDTFPFPKWQSLTNECFRNYKNQLLKYSSLMGELGLRKEIVKYLRVYRDVKCSVDQILITSGTVEALTLACQLLRSDTTAIAMEDPGFRAAYLAFRNQGFRVDPIPLNHHGINVKALHTSIAKAVYVTPSHQFPTGSIMSITRRLRLIEWAYEQNGYIIEDDYSSHLRYDVKPISSLQGLAPEKVIYIGSFSKMLLPSLRVAYMVLPKNLVQKLQGQSDFIACSVPFLIQKPLQLFMQEGYFESHVRKMINHFKKKHKALVCALQENFGDEISISGQNAGIHLLLEIKCSASAQKLIEQAAKAGIAISTSGKSWVHFAPHSYPCILLGFSAIALDDILPAVRLLRKIWSSEK